MPMTIETSKSKSSSGATVNSLAKNGSVSAVRVAVNFPSRYIPVLGLVLAIVTIFSSMVLNCYYGSDIGVLPWPYIR